MFPVYFVNYVTSLYHRLNSSSQRIVAKRCLLYKKLCYAGGYGGGEEDMDGGFACNPHEHYAFSSIQAMLSKIKKSIKEDGKPLDEKHFDSCCKEGWDEGYKDGYRGRSMNEEYSLDE